MGLFNRKKKDIYNYFETVLQTIRSYPRDKNPIVSSIIHGISSTVSTLGVDLIQRTKKGVIKIWDDPILFQLEQPNEKDSATQFLYKMTKSYLETGNTYIYKLPSRWDVLPSSKVRTDVEGKTKIFSYAGMRLTDKEILHIYNPQYYNEVIGFSFLDKNPQLIELSNILIYYIDTYFRHSAGNRLTIELDTTAIAGLKDENIKREFDRWLKENVLNSDTSGKPILLKPGMKAGKIEQPSNAEAELSSLLDRIERQIANGFQYPIYKLTGEYGNNLGSQQISYLQNCILPITEIFAEKLTTLLAGPFAQFQSIKFDYSNLIMPDVETQHRMLREDKNGGLLTTDEARSKIGMGTYSGEAEKVGDVLFNNAALVPLLNKYMNLYFASAQEKLSKNGE